MVVLCLLLFFAASLMLLVFCSLHNDSNWFIILQRVVVCLVVVVFEWTRSGVVRLFLIEFCFLRVVCLVLCFLFRLGKNFSLLSSFHQLVLKFFFLIFWADHSSMPQVACIWIGGYQFLVPEIVHAFHKLIFDLE